MKHFYSIITTFSIFALQPCYAMNKKPKNITRAKIIHTINTIKEPQSVVCFPGDIVAIEGAEECSIYNIAKKQERKRINRNDTIKCIAGHPTKPLLAILSKNISKQCYLRIYNVLSGNKIAQLSQYSLHEPLIFNPMNDTILVRSAFSELCMLNYEILSEFTLYKIKNTFTPIIAFNPKKTECAFYQSNTMTILNTQTFKDAHNNKIPINHSLNALLYSADGSLIICNTDRGTENYIIDSSFNLKHYECDAHFHAVAMHPTSFILAGYSAQIEYIYYINTKDGSIIASTTLPFSQIHHHCNQQYINFSCDGTKLIVATKNKCLVIEIPFDTHLNKIYQSGTINKCISALCVLCKCFDKYDNTLPQDVRQFLINYLLELSHY